MANVIATGSELQVNVTTTDNIITITDVESNVIVSNVTNAVTTVTVDSTEYTVNVAPLTSVSNAAIRAALSVDDTGGDGSLTYSNTTGVFTYTGPSQAEVLAHFANVEPIQLEANGRLSIDEAALFSGKTTDDLAEGTNNKYWSTTGNPVTTTYLTEGTNLYFTNARANAAFVDSLDNITTNIVSTANIITSASFVGNISGTTGDFTGNVDIDGVLTPTQAILKQYNETVVSSGNLSGAVTFDLADGSVFKGTMVGDITGITLSNVTAGSFVTIILSQDGFGGHEITNDLSWQWGANTFAVDQTVNSETVVTVTYDGTNYLASLVRFDNQANSFILNGQTIYLGGNVTLDTDDIPEGTTNLYLNGAGTTDDLTQGAVNKYYSDTLVYDYLNDPSPSTGYTGNLRVVGEIESTYLKSKAALDTNEDFDYTGFVNAVRHNVGPGATDFAIMAYDNSTARWVFADGPVSIANATNSYSIPLDTDDLPEGNANLYYTDARANTAITTYFGDNANSPFTINGNLQVQGNIDYVNVEDLLVNDQSITLNYGNATARDAFIYVDRSGSTLTNAHIKWNETADQWEINDGTSTYVIPRTTSDLTEGTNLYFTDARANSAMDAYLTSITANVDSVNGQTGVVVLDTGDLQENGNLFFTTARANSAMDAYLTSITANVDSVNGATGVVVLDTDDISQGTTNLYFANSLVDNWLTGKTTDDLTQGSTNLYFANSLVDAYLTGGTGIDYASGTIDLANTAVTPDTYGNATYVPQITVDQQGRLTAVTNVAISGITSANSFGIISVSGQSNVEADVATDQVTFVAGSGMTITTDAANDSVTFTSTGGYGNADVQNFLENGYSAANIDANNIVAVTFTGDGSDLTDVRAESVEVTLKNVSGANIAAGYPVHATGYSGSGEVECVLADAGNAQLMPAHFIAQDSMINGATGRGILSGRIQNVDTSSFTVGDTIYVAVGGGYANVAPSGEANLIQNLGIVTRIDATVGGGEVMGAGRTAATPNLDDGAIFVGSSANKAIAVDTTNNFDVSDTEFDLANALSNVNSITSEASTNLTLNTDTLLSVTQNVNGQDIYAANIKSSGYALQVGGDGVTWPQDRAYVDYSGSANLTALYFEGNITAGSNVITDIAGIVRWPDNQSGFSISDVQEYMYVGGDSSAFSISSPFPQGTYVTAIDTGNSTVTVSADALSNATLGPSNPMVFYPAAVDTSTGLVIYLESFTRDTVLDFAYPINIVYGYPATGPANTDFNYSYGTSSDYTFGDSSRFTMAKISQEAPNSTFNNRRGIIIGESGDMSNRGYQDNFQSFGLNVLWDGNTPTDSYANSTTTLNQILFRQWTDNTGQSGSLSGQGPRLFFASNYGKESNNFTDWYARENQELGRLSFWSSNERRSAPSSISPPAFISVQAANDYDTANSVTTVGGNADVYFGAISDAKTTVVPDVYLAYQKGKLTLAANRGLGIDFRPALSGGGANPQNVYSGTTDKKWGTFNYANVSATSGSKFTVSHGDSYGAGVVGDMQVSMKRTDNSQTITDLGVTAWGNGNTIVELQSLGFTVTDANVNANSITLIQNAGTADQMADGTAVTFANASGDPGNVSVNGSTYYTRFQVNTGDYFYTLYTDSGLTTEALYTNAWSGSYIAGVIPYETGWGGDYDYTINSGVTTKEYVFDLEEQSDDLKLKVDATTAVTFHSNTDVTFAGNITYTNQTDGTVTSVDSGAGLTGGPITTSGTLAVGAGYGITVNADDIELNNTAVQAQANAALAAGGIVNATLGTNNIWLGSGGSVPTETAFDSALSTNITNTNVALKRFNETVETTANVSGAVSFDVANGSIFKANVTGDITSLALTNATAGTSATLILTQGATTGTLTAGASWLWAGGTKTLSTTTGDVDIISVVYDGTNYYASLTTGYVT